MEYQKKIGKDLKNIGKYLKYLRNNPDSEKSLYVYSFKGKHR